MKKVIDETGYIKYVTNKWEVYGYDEATDPPTLTIHNSAFSDTENEALEYTRNQIIGIFPKIRMSHAILQDVDVEDPHRDNRFDNLVTESSNVLEGEFITEVNQELISN